MSGPDAAVIVQALACGKVGCACAATARRGHGLTHCAAHLDENPSLSISESREGRPLFYCHGGCPQEAVLAAVERAIQAAGYVGDPTPPLLAYLALTSRLLERPHLLSLPRFAWPCCLLRPVKASRASLVAFDGNRYSVPAAYAGRNLMLRGFVDRVELAQGERVIARHPRSYERGQDVLDPYHFLPALLRKPGAFHQARAVRQHLWPPEFQEALARLEERYPDGAGTKEFLRILALQAEVGEQRLGEALRLALRYGCLRADAVRHLLHYLSAPRTPVPRVDLAALGLAAPTVPVRDVALYNQLLASAPTGGG